MAKMLTTWQAIQDAADSYTGTQRSVSGLVGGDGLAVYEEERPLVVRGLDEVSNLLLFDLRG